MSNIEQANTLIDAHHIPFTSSSFASRNLMSLPRATQEPNTNSFSAIPVSLVNHQEPIIQERMTNTLAIETQNEARAANLEVPSVNQALATGNEESNKVNSDGSSVTSYDSDKEKNSPKEIKRVNINLEEPKGNVEADKKQVENKNTGKDGEVVGAVEVKGFGNRDHYLSQGQIIFKILETKFRKNAKLDSKHKPYIKFRLGFNSAKTKPLTVEGQNIKYEDEIKVKYTNQDQVRIKVKGKGKLIDNTIARTKVSIVDVVMEGRQTVWVPLLKGDDVVGEMHLDMRFGAKRDKKTEAAINDFYNNEGF